MEFNVKEIAKVAELLREKFLTSDISEGLLPDEKADRFIDLLVDESALLSQVTVYRTNYRAGTFSSIDLAQPVTQSASEGASAEEETGLPTVTAANYTCNKIRSAFYLTWEDLTWNLERGNFEDTVVRMWNRRMRMDLEMLGLHGDADKYANPDTAYEKLVDIDDGWIELALNDANTHIVDFTDATSGEPTTVDTATWVKMYTALPERYKTGNLRWIAAPRIITDYRYYLASRNTDLGDAMLAGNPTITPHGIPFLEVPLMPANLGTGGNETVILLTDPKNLVFVIHRELRLRTVEKPLEDKVWFAGFGYVDYVILNTDALVVGKGIKFAEY